MVGYSPWGHKESDMTEWLHFHFHFKNDRMISVRFQGKPFNIMVIQVYALTSKAEEAEVEQFYEDLQDLLGLTPPKKMSFSS